MINKNQLQLFTPTELLFLQRHVKLGKNHLEKILTEEEIKTIFHFTEISSEIHGELSSNTPEIAGAITLVVNTILTATLGAWMGLSGFLHLHLGSPKIFFTVLGFALFMGGLIGWLNARLVWKNAERAIEQRKLQDFEVAILQEVIHQRKEELKEKTNELASILDRLEIQTNVQEIQSGTHLQKICLNWIEQFCKKMDQNLPKQSILELQKIKTDLEKRVEIEEKKKEQKSKSLPIFEKLSHSSANFTFDLKSWIRSRYKILLVQLIPTIFGGFSSLFVYLGGVPRIAQEMQFSVLVDFLNRPEIKTYQLILSILTTIYFGCCFIYISIKSFHREQELSRTQMLITRNGNTIDLLDDQLLRVKKALDLAKELSYAQGH